MKRRISRRERGIAMAYVAAALLPLIGLVALAMQWAQMTVTQAALQDYVDSRAIAAIKDRFGGFTEPVDLAVFLKDQTDPGTDPQCGGWDHGAGTFDSASPCASSVGTPAHRVEHTISVPVLFAPFATLVGGAPTADLTASATSFIPRRQVMLVQDTSGSMNGQIGAARDSLHSVVDTMESQDLPGDEVGLVEFNSDANLRASLTDLTGDTSGLEAAIDALSTSGSTCIADGIRAARLAFDSSLPEHEAGQLMIVATDGDPYCDGQTTQAFDEAVAERQATCGGSIDIWTIAIGDNVDPDKVKELACTEEQMIEISGSSEIEDAVVQILTQTRVRLVD